MSSRTKGNLYILLTALLWSTGGLLIKYIPGNAVAINGARSLIAVVFFWLYKRSIKIRVNRYVISAAVCLVMTNLLYVMANKLTTAANAIVLQYMAPIFVLIWDCIYRKKAPKKQQCGIVLMALAGMVLFFFDQLDGGHLLGNILAIGAGLAFSGVFFINSLPEASSEDASMLAFLASFVISIPFLGDVWKMNQTAVVALLALGIFQVGLAYILFAKGTKLTSPVSASLIGLLEAILNPVWVFLFYGEKVGKFALVGAAVILLAVVLNIVTAGTKCEE
ncbi:MAG: DMT family transporter [Oliverpabstia sp.]|nr:DMT family transporter [Eubacterium sp.]MDY2596378.1 DMT family transporter [Oliverpabstia sp.]